MSGKAHIIFIAIFLTLCFVSSGLRFLTPESHRLLFDSMIALLALFAALFEQNTIKSSFFALLLFLVLPIVFLVGSLVYWYLGTPYRNLNLWVTFVYWDSLILFSLLVYFYILRKKIVK